MAMPRLLVFLLAACSPSPPEEASTPSTTETPTTSTTPTTPTTSTTSTLPPLVDCDAIAIRVDGRTTFYESNPTYDDPEDRLGPYTVVSAAEAGLDEALLNQANQDLAGRPYVNSFLVFREGDLAWEQYFHGSGPQDSNNVHSSSKSILGAAVGVAVSQGLVSLDDSVADHLPTEFGSQADPRKADLTIRHLLTMTSGFAWIEDETEYRLQDEPDWVQAIVDLQLVADPGERFNYSTGNTHLLSAVLQAASGTTTCDYVHEELFRPLDIAAEHWGRDPQGVNSGGYNVYLTPRESARYGLMIADGGRWLGQQVVEESWVEDMLAQQESDAPYGYGYLWWMRDIQGYEVKIAWGYGGQFIYLLPDLDLAVVITTNTGDFDPWFYDAENILGNFVIPAAGG